jgi:uncharacterized protein YutE (UPF0331/DUF86 family)
MGESQLALLREMLDLLARYASSVRRTDLDTDREAWLKVKGALEVAAQCTVDLAIEIVSRRGLGVPQTYREAFEMLARAGVIGGELAGDLAGWAGFRNVLVHAYTVLDLDRLHAALSETAPLRAFHAIAAGEIAGNKTND